MVYDACRIIRERIPEALSGPRESDCPGGWGGALGPFCSQALALGDDSVGLSSLRSVFLGPRFSSLGLRITGKVIR